jgi:hypothetical protein
VPMVSGSSWLLSSFIASPFTNFRVRYIYLTNLTIGGRWVLGGASSKSRTRDCSVHRGPNAGIGRNVPWPPRRRSTGAPFDSMVYH